MRSSLVRLVVLAGITTTLAGCGGDEPTTPEPTPEPTPAPVASVTVSGTVGQPVVGDQIQLAAIVRDAAGEELTDRPVTWTSSSDAVATVSETGLVTTVSPGTAMITASSEERSGRQGVVVHEGARIGPDGGVVTGFGGAVRLEVPAGALSAPVSITVAAATSLPIDPSVVSNSGYVLGPVGTSLGSGALLTLQYDPAGGPSGVPEAQLQVHRRTGSVQPLGGSVDAEANTAAAEITQLGTFLVRRAPPATPCTDPGHSQFDFWVGSWTVAVAGASASSPGAPSDITKEASGCAVFENFANGNGVSINVFDPDTDQWHQTFIFSNGRRQVLIGGMQGSNMVLTGNSPGPAGSFDRWTWFPLSEGQVRQLQEFSSDGGVTVLTGFDGTYSPR